MTDPKIFAVIVGVEDYTDFDPSGGANLPGAQADARSWLHYCIETLGVPHDNIVLLTKRLEGEHERGQGSPTQALHRRAEATYANIRRSMVELGDRMRAEGGPCTAIFAYSGHGLAPRWAGQIREGMSLGIAPCDLSAQDGVVQNAILFGALESWLGELPEHSQVSSFLDCCYSTLPQSLRLDKGKEQSGALQHGPFAGPTVLATELWGSSYFIDTFEGPRGAFTWALLTLLPQWTLRESQGVPFANVSYGNLVFRTRELLAVMGVEQAPVLVGDSRNSMRPVFYPDAVTHIATANTPDKPRRSAQLDDDADHDTGFTLLQVDVKINGVSAPLAQVVVANSGQGGPNGASGLVAGTESWFFAALPSSMASATELVWTILKQDEWNNYQPPAGPQFDTPPLCFKAPVAGNPRAPGAPVKGPVETGPNPMQLSFAMADPVGAVQPFGMTWFWNDDGVRGFSFYNNKPNFKGANGCLHGLLVGETMSVPLTGNSGANPPNFSLFYLSEPGLKGITTHIPDAPDPNQEYWVTGFIRSPNGHGPTGPWSSCKAVQGTPIDLNSITNTPPQVPSGQKISYYIWNTNMDWPMWIDTNGSPVYP